MNEYLFEHLWTTSWQACILCLLIHFVCRFFPKSPQLRYWLWFIVLFRLFIPDGMVPLQDHVPKEISVTIPSSIVVVDPIVPEVIESNVEVITTTEFSWKTLWLLCWLVGVLLLSIHFAYKLRQIFTEIRQCCEINDPEILKMLREISQNLGIRSQVKIYSYKSSRVFHGPCLFGILRPRIILPLHLIKTFSCKELRPIITHELIHIKQRDLWMSYLQTMAQICYFFHPAVWYINRKINQEREFVCDDLSIRSLGDIPTNYAKTLVNSVQMVSTKPTVTFFVVCLAEKQSFLKRRIQRMIQTDYTFPSKNKWHLAMIALVVVFSFSIFGSHADLNLTITTQGSDNVVLYQKRACEIRLQNLSGKPLTNLHLKGTISEQFRIREANQNAVIDNNEVTWNIAEIGVGEEYTFTLQIMGVTKGLAQLEFEVRQGEERVTYSKKSLHIDGLAAIHISSYDTEDPIIVGKDTTYVVEVRNEGTKECENIQLINQISDNLEFLQAVVKENVGYKYDAMNNSLVFEPISRLEPGKKVSYKIRCKAVAEGVGKNKAVFVADSFAKQVIDEESTQLRTTGIQTSALHVSSYDTEDPLEINLDTIYVLEIRNEGLETCENVMVSAELSAELELVSTSRESKVEGKRIFFTQPQTIESGKKVVYKIKCRAVQAGQGKVKAITTYEGNSIINEEITTTY